MNISLEKDISLLKNHSTELKDTIFSLNKYNKVYELKRKERGEAFAEERSAEIRSAELKTEIEVFSRQIDELKKRISGF